MKIAFVDKCPNKLDYRRLYNLSALGNDIDVVNLHMSSVSLQKLKVADIDLEPDFNEYDWVVLIGAEAVQRYSDVRSVANYTGRRVKERPKRSKEVRGAIGYDKFLVSISPALIRMKPETKPVFDGTVQGIHEEILGTVAIKKPTLYTPITTEQVAVDYLEYILNTSIKKTPTIALDTETTGLKARNCEMLGLSISHEEYQGVYIEADALTDKVIFLAQSIINSGRRIVMHNAKFDLHITKYHLGLDYSYPINRKLFHDTMVMHYALDERAGTHGLKALVMKYTDMGDYDRELDEFKKEYCATHGILQDDFTYDLIPFETMWPYAAGDTDGTLRLFNKFYKILCNEQTAKVKWMYDTVLMPATVFLQKMEDRGIPISEKRVQSAKAFLYAELAKYEEAIYQFPEVAAFEAMQGAKFNPNSVAQLQKMFFNVLGLKPTGILTDSGAHSTNKEVLEILAKEHPLPKSIHNYKKTLKILNTFIKALEAGMDADGRVRTNFGCTTTTSGRLSSSGTINAQQLPRDNPIVKGCIVAPKGYKVVAKDLSTAEVYYAAVLSGDKELQKVFLNIVKDPKEYADFHSTIAHMVFGLTCKPSQVKKLYPALRQAAKAINVQITL
jgi:DNA polymerase I-like protein with 3'-5' exonuclease and polymerase domains